MTAKEPSLSTLKRLAEAVSDWAGTVSFAPGSSDYGMMQHALVCDCLAAYRAEIAPVRTRAEVDANIVAVVRAYCTSYPNGLFMETGEALRALCSEPTREAAPEPSPQRDPYAPHHADPDPCSCDESLELRKTIASAHRAVCEAAAILGSEAPDDAGEVERLRKLAGSVKALAETGIEGGSPKAACRAILELFE